MNDKQFFCEQIMLESKGLAMHGAEMHRHRMYGVEDGESGTSV